MRAATQAALARVVSVFGGAHPDHVYGYLKTLVTALPNAAIADDYEALLP